MSKVIFDLDEFEDIISTFIENEYCPEGKIVDGCPLNSDGDVIGCDQCWHEWLTNMGMIESWD